MHRLKDKHPEVKFVLNGGLWNPEQHTYFVEKCGADGTMAATFLLTNPFFYGPYSMEDNLPEQQAPAILRWRTEDEMQAVINRIHEIPEFDSLREEITDRRNGADLQPASYCYNPMLANYDPKASLSTDMLLDLTKRSAIGRPANTMYLNYPMPLRRQILVSAIDIIDNWKYCQQEGLEAPWGGMLGHVIHCCERDLMNSNIDVRGALTTKTCPPNADYRTHRLL